MVGNHMGMVIIPTIAELKSIAIEIVTCIACIAIEIEYCIAIDNILYCHRHVYNIAIEIVTCIAIKIVTRGAKSVTFLSHV